MYKKYTLEEVKPIIENLVKKYINKENFLNDVSYKELINLTHYHTPISDSKKCCLNCDYGICHLKDYSQYCYCEHYNPKVRPVIYYQKPIFNKNWKEPTLEEKIEKDVNKFLEDYKNTLNYCKELEEMIPKNVTTQFFDQETLNKEKEFQKKQKKYWTEFMATFDTKEIKENSFKGMDIYSIKPNKEKQKAFFEKWSKCPMEMVIESIGLKNENSFE